MAPIHWIAIAAFALVCVLVVFAVSGGSARKKPPQAAAEPRAPGDVSPKVDEYIRQGQKIMAVKQVREETGLGLKEAKDLVEARERGIAAGLRPEPAPAPGVRDANEAVEPSAAVVDLARRGETIMAIKLLREESGLGLAEAKKIVDSLGANR